jgi:hypothetical protein
MSNLEPKRLYIGSDTDSNVYTVSSTTGSYAIIRNFNACNTTSEDKTYSLHIIPSSGTAGNNNKIMSNIVVPANDVLISSGPYVLNAGDSIYLSQSAASITLNISGVEYIA